LIHPHPEAVAALLFNSREPFFDATDKVQVKYEMLRAHVVDGTDVTLAAATHGYSRAAFYLVAASFEERGMLGLVDELLAFLRSAEPSRSGAQLAEEIEQVFGVRLHRRTIERARRP
jgi:hypothetical protein